MHHFRYFLFTLFFPIGLMAQNATIEGYVLDENSNERLAFATVKLVGESTDLLTGVVTDSSGYFQIKVEAGLYNLEASYTGYQPLVQYEVLAKTAKPIRVDFSLHKSTLETVEVTASSLRKSAESPVSKLTFNRHEIERLPGATMDISKFIKTLPGVSTRVSFGYNLIVRGGASLENRFYLDGIEIPAITHFNVQGTSGGPNGLINTRLLSGAEVHSGAFPANRPNALSSVTELHQREGRKDRFTGSFTLGATDWGFIIEGPMGKKSSYVLSARESYSQHLLKAIGLPVIPFYSDVQYKQKIRFDEKNELTLVGLGGYDKYELNLDAEASESLLYNIGYIPEGKQFLYTIGANYKHFLDNNSVYNVVLSQNYFQNQADKFLGNTYLEEDRILAFKSQERETKLRIEQRFFREKGEFSYGINGEYDAVNTDNYSLFTFKDGSTDSISYVTDLSMLRYGGFASYSQQLAGGKWNLFGGIRFDGNTYSSRMSNPLKQLSPRVAASYQFAEGWAWNTNAGVYYQIPPYLLLSFQQNGELVNQNTLDYMRSAQVVTGIEHTTKSGYHLQLEAFYKKYDRYPFLTYDSISYANANANYVYVGNQPADANSVGRAFGADIQVKQKFKKSWFWMLSYSYVVSQFKDTKDNYVSSSWDNRHFGNIAAGKTLKGNWQIGIRYSFSGGNPYTPYDIALSARKEVWDVNQRGLFDFERLNQERLSFYQQFDIRVDKVFNFKKWTLSTYLDIANAGRSNIELLPYLTVERDEENQPLTDPANADSYLTKIIASDSGRVLPTIGLIVDF